jgi:hypothetical protein
MVIAFLIAWSLMSHSWDLMDSLTPFHVGWDKFVDMFLKFLCWFMILFLWCFFWFFLCWFFNSLSPFCSNDYTRSFLRAYISRYASYGDSMACFMNQILHLTNLHDKLSIFVLYPSLRFPSIYRLTLWDPRLRPISLFSHAGWRLWEGEHELWWSQSFAWSDWDTDGSPYACSWHSIRYIVTSSLLCEHSHTLSLYLLEMWIALVLSWSRSMYYNCSILYLASCAAWFVLCLWSASVILYLRLVRLNLFTALCHSALVATHVCSIIVFIFSVDVTFSWLVSTLILRWVTLVIHIFLVVDGE